ncbi:hypothetical protein GOV12_01745 [Candidatus Pacearchaeota archaeon]|nr:hypothetical protein [Candidatus Pacearchaeota archaeon]
METRYNPETPISQEGYSEQMTANQEIRETSGLQPIIHGTIGGLIGLAGIVIGGLVARESGGPAGIAVFGVSVFTMLGYMDMFAGPSENYQNSE